MRSWLIGAVLTAAVTAQAAPFAYVPGSGFSSSTLTIVDTATDTIVTSFPILRFAQGAAVSPDGTTVYISSIADDNVAVLNAFNNTISGSVPLTPFPGGSPVAIAVNTAGTRLYAAAGAAKVTVVDLTTNMVIADISSPGVIDNPGGVTVTPNGAKAYATNVFSGAHVVAIDTATNTIVQSLPNTGSRGMDAHPDSSKVYAADTEGFPNGVSVIDTATDTLITKVATAFAPLAVRVHPDGSRVYVVGNTQMAVIDTATNMVGPSVPTGGLHFGVDINPTGTKLYLPVHSSALQVRDADTLALITTIPVAGEAFARGRFIGPAFACGNGVHEPAEECDDGNVVSGDCCASDCQLETCDDGDICTVDSCVAPIGCVTGPHSCRTAEKSILLIKDNSDDTKDKFLWKWIKGQSTDLADFGTPTASTDYTLCLYAGTTASPIVRYSIPADALRWSSSAAGYKFKDEAGTPHGIQKSVLKWSDQDKAKILVKGKGMNLPALPGLDTMPTPILVQLLNDSTPACWQGSFSAANVTQSETQLKGKAEN